VLPKTFALDQGQSVELSITIESTAPPAQFFGEVRLVPKRVGYPTLHLPVAFVTGQASASLVSDCSPTRIPERGVSICTITAQNNSFIDTTVDLRTTLNNKLKVDSASGAFIIDNRTVEKPNVPLTGAVAGVPSVDPGAGPAGYLPLDLFGIAPDAIGDEEFINYNVPAYVYNGVTHTTIGVNSNGYLVAGGGTSEDNNCCNLPAGASPSRPNNLLAPFWTDLDGGGAPGIFAGTLTDGVSTWLVVEHRVNVFGTNDLRAFQTWIGLNGTQDISYAYDPADLPSDPAGQDYLVGAENSAGQGDVSMFLPTEDLVVTSSDPSPGASVSYTVTVKGVQQGAGVVTSEMSSADLIGVTMTTSTVTVGRPVGNRHN
jgi:hypothetical protein